MKRFNRIVIFCAVLLLLVWMVGGKKLLNSFSKAKKEYQYISLFSEVTALVRSEYVEEVEPDRTFPGAYSAMLASLDRTSAYLDSTRTVLYNLYLQGKTCGSGIYGTKSADYFLVTDVAEGSPAKRAGLKPGDMIKAVNGKSIFGLSYWEMYLSLQTAKPAALDIVIFKKGAATPSRLTIKTKSPTFSTSAVGKKIKKDILLVKLPRLDETHAGALEQLLEKESSAAEGKPLKLILDLRQYSGGSMNALTRVARLLLPGPVNLAVKTKQKEETISLGSGDAYKYRAAVILDVSTIMYGELLAALLKSSASPVTLVGTKTRGFISKLKHIPLSDGSSIVITEGLFLLDGKNLADSGITPDIEIKKEDTAGIIDRCIAVLDTPQKPMAHEAKEQHTHEKNQEKK
jgi:carboxyl-terminal processing protease